MAYSKHTWETNEPITKTRMNAIEQGIEDAHTGIEGINSAIGDRSNNSATLVARLDAVERTAGTANTNAADALIIANQAAIDTGAGKTAMGQIHKATDESIPPYDNLISRFTTIDNRLTALDNTKEGQPGRVRILEIEVGAAHDPSVANDTLDARFDRIEQLNEQQGNAISNLIQDITQAAQTQGTDYLNVAMNYLQDHIDEVKDEVEEARGTNTQGNAREALIDHFIDNEAAISTAQQSANDANTEISKVKATLGVTVSATPAKTVAAMITEAQTAAQTYTDTQIANNNTTKSIDEIIGAHSSTANDTTYVSLNARFEDAESRLNTLDDSSNGSIAALTDRVDNLEDELSIDSETGALERVDTIEANVLAISKEIGMLQDEATILPAETSINRNNTRIDNVIGEVETARSTYDNLNARLSAIDTSIEDLDNTLNETTNGVVDRLGNVSALADETASALNTLTGRVSDLENEDSTSTVVIDNATFDTDGSPIIEDANSDIDYLIKDGDKYYYWKYINNKWQLISGAGNGGTSSAVIAAELPAAAEANVNTDYFIGTESEHYIHYRYKNINGTLVPIIISNYSVVSQDNVKSYQMATSSEEENGDITQFLDFYGFDYGTSKTSESIDPEDDLIYRLAHIPLPKGGSGAMESTKYRIYGQIRGESNRRMSLIDAQENGITFEYGCTCYNYDGDSYDYRTISYTLTREGSNEILASDSISSLEKDIYSANGVNITIPHIENYCETNQVNTFILTLSAAPPLGYEGVINNKVITAYVTVVELQLSSTFSDQSTQSTNSNLRIPYTFEGINDIIPDFIVTLDNTAINPIITSTEIVIRQQEIANLTGVHNLAIRASQTISGSTLYSNTLNYQLGFVTGTAADSIMLFSGSSMEVLELEQYQILKIPYYLYVPNNESAIVNYMAEQLTYNDQGQIISRINTPALARPAATLKSNAYEYTVRINEMIEDIEYYTITMTCSDKTLVFNIKVKKAAEQINIETNHLLFDFKPERFTNNASLEERLWSETRNGVKYSMQVPNGAHFDWRTGGWITDENDVPCFCVKAGSRVQFVKQAVGSSTTSPLTLFWPNMETNGGSNFKCTFKIDNVKTPDAPFLTSLDKSSNTLTNYGKTILASKQDVEDDESLLHSYLNTKYIYTKTINSANKVVKEAISTTVINSEPFSSKITETERAAAEDAAREKNTKNIKKYIGNIYKIANQAESQEHREYLLKLLAGKANDAVIDYSTISDEIETYLQVLTNANNVYTRLVNEGNNPSTVTYEYRQEEAVNYDAMLNGFVVEGKDGKDGIIAMIEFTFVSEIKTGGNFTQTVSVDPISINTFAKTGTFRVMVTNTQTNEVKEYEVEVLDKNISSNYTEIVSIKDASDKITRSYGLELNALGSNIYLSSGIVNYAHSEGDIIEFEYNINPAIEGRINSSIIIYEDGVPSAAKLYSTGNRTFEQDDPDGLTIGSNDCDIYIYKMRLYDRALSNEAILKNFYADGLTVDEMMQRYNRNKNLVNNANNITPQLIAQECPDLRIIMIEAPNLTGGKTSFIKDTKIRCIYKNGRPEDNWVALNAYHAGQGTSSDNYGAAGRNLDIIFGFNGEDPVIVPKPQKNNYQFNPNYKSIVVTGLSDDTTNDIKSAEEYEAAGYNVIYNGQGKVSLSENSVPNNWFNIKVNIASSENANNAYLQKRFDRYLPYTTPARLRGKAMNPQIDIKNDMEFFNCVIFIKETDTPSEFTEDKNIAVENRPWHFYGIGNIGDSKKTDATRANIPGDPYEFCIEISDNGLKNSGFCSGVFYISEASKNRALATPDNTLINNAKEAHICANNEYTVNGNSYTFSIVGIRTDTLYLVPVITEAFTYYRRFMYNNSSWIEIGEPITFERTSYGIKYPVSKAEWECSLNTYHSALYDTTSGKGWDKSFEFRYDITTKDGETVARNELEAVMNDLHQQTNKKAFADMYSWIVTSTNDEFKNEFDTITPNATSTWFIKKSPLYWYLFTERYTMIDSRAKNTFYHYGKIYITDAEADGTLVSQLETAAQNPAVYAVENNIIGSGNITAEQIATEEIAFRLASARFVQENAQYFTHDNEQAAINNGYRFELWDYDNDTALGINNNGQMVFSAGLEDIDKDVSGWIYNEAESIIWRRIRENTYEYLGALYVDLKQQCFNAENLIQEFDRVQNEFPEELWRMDFIRKYYRPFIEKNETIYLNDMANGRKRYQRRQFERNMAIYINSKYQRNGAYIDDDLISFRPQFEWRPGLDTQITVKPYSTMYINFALGNQDNTSDPALSVRVQRGEPYIIDPAALGIHNFQNIQCIIYNASRIMELDGLGKFYCQQISLGPAKKLTTVILGNSDETYTNRSMDEIGKLGLSGGLPLLETLDLQNIWFTTPPTVLDLSNFPLLKNLNANGCNIQSFTFKEGGMLEKITFPQVLTKIEFNNLYNLVDTINEDEEIVHGVELTGAANLTSYNSINSYPNSWEIVSNMISNAGVNGITQLTLNDIDWEIGDISVLSPLSELYSKLGASKMSLEGHIKVTGKWSDVEVTAYNAIWPLVEFECTGQKITKYKVEYRYDPETKPDPNKLGYGQLIETLYVERSDIEDIVTTGKISLSELTKPSTAEFEYTFGSRTTTNDYQPLSGWHKHGSTIPLNQDTSITIIDRDYVFETHFIGKKRTYLIRWYMNRNDATSLVADSKTGVYYGDGYTVIAPTVLDITKAQKPTVYTSFTENNTLSYDIFDGWEQLPTNIQPDGSTTYYNIYAKWKHGTIDYDTLEENTELTPEILLALSASNSESDRTKVLAPYDSLQVTMGYEGLVDGIELVSVDAPTRFDSQTTTSISIAGQSTTYPNGIQPFLDSSKPFTLAIDYRFNITELRQQASGAQQSVLMGCEDLNINGSVQSLKLYYDYATGTPRIGFGDTRGNNSTNQSVAIGSANRYDSNNNLISEGTVSYRNIVVLRHPANAEYIDVYCGYNGGLDTNNQVIGLVKDYTPSKFVQRINWPNSNSLNSSKPLILGHSVLNPVTELDGQQDQYIRGKGTIYWAKYWPQDLGTGECVQLAAWPHEKTTFAIEDFQGMDRRVVSTSITQPNITLTTITASETCPLTINRANLTTAGNIIGWGNSDLRTYANERIFNGLPITLQAIIAPSGVRYMEAEVTSNPGGGYIANITGIARSTYDKVFFPSYIELTNNNNSTYLYEANGGYEWINSSKMQVWQYTSTGDQPNQVNGNTNYARLRFPMIPIDDIPKIYLYPSNQTVSLYERIVNSEIGRTAPDRGTIMIVTNNSSLTTAFIYATVDDVRNGAPIVPGTGIFYCERGGWVPSTSYWTRTTYHQNQNYYPFIYVSALGEITTNVPDGFSIQGTLTSGLDYSISI